MGYFIALGTRIEATVLVLLVPNRSEHDRLFDGSL